jgi:hypothetical protein
MKRMLFAIVLTFSAAPAVLLVAPEAHAAPADVICMVITTSGSRGTTNELTILATPQTAPSMTDRGFAVRPCAGKENQISEYRTKVCNLAQNTPQAIQSAINTAHKITLAELCAMANSLMVN